MVSSDSEPLLAISAPSARGAVTAHVRASGASLCDLTVGMHDVIPRDTTAARRNWFHGVSLAPWPNRLRDGAWTHDGRQLRGDCNDPRGHALHGLVAEREFDVVRHTTSSITFGTTIGDDPVYPWPLRVEVSYSVGAQGLSASISATNLSSARVPVGLGVHPYFAFDDASTIVVPARSVCENDDRLIPTGGLMSPTQLGLDRNAPTPLTQVALDDCFTDLIRDTEGLAHTIVVRGDGSTIDVWQDASLPYTQVFILRDFPWADTAAHGVAIEPQTCPANALQTGTDLHWLEQDDRLTCHWGVDFTPAGVAGSE